METPAAMVYASVLLLEIVHIAFLLEYLKDLGVFSSDVHNAYLNAPHHKKSWFKSGPEFVQYEGHVFVTFRALYGMASSAASWWN